MIKNLFHYVIVSSFIMGAIGCKTAPKMNLFSKRSAEPTAIPQNIVALWKDDVMTSSGSEPARGLGGRLYFYDENNHPIAVNGKLVVYAYDDSTQQQLNREPERKYVFEDSELQTHFSESDIGPSYSVWLPWDKAGGAHAEVSLIPMLTTAEGKVIIGEHSRHVLTGKNVPPPKSQITSKLEGTSVQETTLPQASNGEYIEDTTSRLQPVGFQQPVDTVQPRSIRSASIPLPDSVRMRLARSTEFTDSRLERRREMQTRPTAVKPISKPMNDTATTNPPTNTEVATGAK